MTNVYCVNSNSNFYFILYFNKIQGIKELLFAINVEINELVFCRQIKQT